MNRIIKSECGILFHSAVFRFFLLGLFVLPLSVVILMKWQDIQFIRNRDAALQNEQKLVLSYLGSDQTTLPEQRKLLQEYLHLSDKMADIYSGQAEGDIQTEIDYFETVTKLKEEYHMEKEFSGSSSEELIARTEELKWMQQRGIIPLPTPYQLTGLNVARYFFSSGLLAIAFLLLMLILTDIWLNEYVNGASNRFYTCGYSQTSIYWSKIVLSFGAAIIEIAFLVLVWIGIGLFAGYGFPGNPIFNNGVCYELPKYLIRCLFLWLGNSLVVTAFGCALGSAVHDLTAYISYSVLILMGCFLLRYLHDSIWTGFSLTFDGSIMQIDFSHYWIIFIVLVLSFVALGRYLFPLMPKDQ